MQQAGNAFAGAAFHCYEGNVADQDNFHNAYPSKEIYFTECTGSMGSDWWSDIKVCLRLDLIPADLSINACVLIVVHGHSVRSIFGG